jgi:hypothetical protein
MNRPAHFHVGVRRSLFRCSEAELGLSMRDELAKRQVDTELRIRRGNDRE